MAKNVQLLQTKLHRPALPSDLVPRARLLERLEAGRMRPLTLVSAPAGYGKSVLIANWLESIDWPSAWLSLDADESDLRQFLAYFIAAVRTVFPNALEETLKIASAAQLPPLPELTASAANELDALERPFFLVLDDYHRVDADSPVNALLERLLLRPPVPLHLAVVSRRDPAIPLVALRARGQMNEVRTQDLRFDASEVRALLKNAADFAATDDVLGDLEQELEGWAVGLRLVSLALRDTQDPRPLIGGLQGGVQQAQAYLIQEVIARLPDRLRDWLLKSAILERFCGDLCDAVCADEGAHAAQEMNGDGFVRTVSGANLFSIALDSRGEWFRFHHLFRDLLLGELVQRSATEEIAQLHKRASRWFESRGFVEEAIRHVLKGDDATGAAQIVERHVRAELNRDHWYVLRKWLSMLPVDVKHQREGLLLTQAWVSKSSFDLAKIPAILERIEALPAERTAATLVARDLNFFKAVLHYWQGEGDESLAFLERVVDERPLDPGFIEGDYAHYLGLALCMIGRKQEALEKLTALLRGVDLPGSYHLMLLGSVTFVHFLSGELFQVGMQAKRVAAVANAEGMENSEAWSDYLHGCVHLHCNELDPALHFFGNAVPRRRLMHPRAAIDALAALALTQALLGRAGDVNETLERVQEFAAELNEPQYALVAHACEARTRLILGEPGPASRWSDAVVLGSMPDELLFWLEVPAITRARTLIALGTDESLSAAQAQLDAIRQQSEKWHYSCQSIEVAVLQSLALDKQGRDAEALAALQDALAMAAAGGWIRPFVELGEPMARMLERLFDGGRPTDHAYRVLEALNARRAQAATALGVRPWAAADLEIETAERLTRRERDILELLAQRLQNKEIAVRLFVSPETVKSHLKHLYGKLGVRNRRDAAARAAEIVGAARVAHGALQ